MNEKQISFSFLNSLLSLFHKNRSVNVTHRVCIWMRNFLFFRIRRKFHRRRDRVAKTIAIPTTNSSLLFCNESLRKHFQFPLKNRREQRAEKRNISLPFPGKAWFSVRFPLVYRIFHRIHPMILANQKVSSIRHVSVLTKIYFPIIVHS